MAVVGDFLVGKALELLYGGVETLIANNLLFESLSTDIKAKLDALRPMIQKMVQRNHQPDCPEDPVLRDLRVLMEEGAVVVCKCFSKIRIWNFYKKYKYTNKLLKLNEALEKQLSLLNVRVAVVTDENNGILHELLDIANQNKSAAIEAGCALPELPSLIVGLDIPLKELKMEFFKDEVSLLVLTAPGGCGKTTLATKFCQDQDVKDKFKDNIFFVTVSKKPKLELIMTELYKQKDYKVPTFQNGVFPVKWLQQIVKDEGDNPLLLVLDDVWSGSESILQKFEFKMSNYKILVTSRSEFPRFGPSYHLQLLDDDNAMQLFHHTAFLGDKSSHIPNDLAKKIVKHCNGFPLAITVVGRSLCSQPIQTWRSRVNEWSKGASVLDCEMELFQCLQSSFDALDNATPKVKDCLLDLGAFPEDSEIQVTALIDMWAELYDLDEEMSCIAKLYELNNRSLALLQGDMRLEVVQEAIEYNRYVVRQHDLLRELAIYNSKRDPMEHRERLIIEICGNNVPKWWREQKYPYINARLVSISTDGEFSVKLPDMELPKAEVLVLNSQSERSYALPEFVERMHKLRMLLVINYTRRAKLDNFQLLGSLSNLRTLRLDGIDLSCLTKSPVQLKNLHKLYLRACGYNSRDLKLSHIIFPNLKEIVFESCLLLEFTGVLCELIHLTKLKITSRFRLSNLSEAIANLVNLEALTLDVGLVAGIPESIGNLRKLKLLKINNDRDLEKLPEQMGMLKCLRHLIIEGCSRLSALPESIGNLVNLEVLSLRYCTHLSELPESIRNLQKLNFLDMYRCIEIEELPEHFGELKSLMKLQMVGCYALRKLPESVSDLEQLEQVICVDWDATHLWTPLLPTLKNLRIVVREGSKSFVPCCPTSPPVDMVEKFLIAFERLFRKPRVRGAPGC
ncbi:PREDICTED: probable disease resistance protein At5g66900 [Fragaria vesca subsp. vesca]|uniref:probable disease resistance protein At5g66900 n=1 Tax=Fragaria vesca subsp. vesca TaxID=101020 RepID=UPI0002C359D3|nr:PREDICTED: probable disease resistance protein At5g66900 [Fragaria vesca subsp. vesca]